MIISNSALNEHPILLDETTKLVCLLIRCKNPEEQAKVIESGITYGLHKFWVLKCVGTTKGIQISVGLVDRLKQIAEFREVNEFINSQK